jgi:hypothetical protein
LGGAAAPATLSPEPWIDCENQYPSNKFQQKKTKYAGVLVCVSTVTHRGASLGHDRRVDDPLAVAFDEYRAKRSAGAELFRNSAELLRCWWWWVEEECESIEISIESKNEVLTAKNRKKSERHFKINAGDGA